jgi:hypothetical protein
MRLAMVAEIVKMEVEFSIAAIPWLMTISIQIAESYYGFQRLPANSA